MTGIRNESAARISAALLAMLLAACTSPGPSATSADSARSAENQKKQSELKGMEAAGQRNDIDKPFK